MKVVAVLRGGLSNEHDISLKTGAAVLQNLGEAVHLLDVYISKEGVWHVRGVPMEPERILGTVDVVFNALHGAYGEDGEVQRLLNRLRVPYTGSDALASALAMNKQVSKRLLKKTGALTPYSITLSVSPHLESELYEVFRTFPQPSVIKPVHSGSSVGITLARSFDEFKAGVAHAFQHSKEVLIEEFVKGKEATVGVVDRLRGRAQYTLPPIEIIPKVGATFFDTDAKYSGASEERCPGNFSLSEMRQLQELASRAHVIFGARHYSRSDFIVAPQGVYFLETNTLPGLTKESLLPKSLAAVGVTLPQFLHHVIDLADSKG